MTYDKKYLDSLGMKQTREFFKKEQIFAFDMDDEGIEGEYYLILDWVDNTLSNILISVYNPKDKIVRSNNKAEFFYNFLEEFLEMVKDEKFSSVDNNMKAKILLTKTATECKII